MKNVARRTSQSSRVLRRMSVLGLVNIVCLIVLIGCGGNVSYEQLQDEPSAPTTTSERPTPVEVIIPPNDGQDASGDAPDPQPETPTINAIDFEHDPDEVAVPNGALSDEVMAIAWHFGDQYIQVPSTWAWSVTDPVVAQMAFVPGSEQSNTQYLISSIDVFDSPNQETEPFCELLACAIPAGAPPNTTDPVCGKLPLASVIHIAGTWNCQGMPHGDSQISISQVGRWLTVNSTGQGTVFSRIADFYYQEFEFRAELSDRTHMAGTYWLAGDPNVLGTWSASRVE